MVASVYLPITQIGKQMLVTLNVFAKITHNFIVSLLAAKSGCMKWLLQS